MAKLKPQEPPLIDVIDSLKREREMSAARFEASDLNKIKERSPNAIISHMKYSNPLICSPPHLNSVNLPDSPRLKNARQEGNTAAYNAASIGASAKKPPKP